MPPDPTSREDRKQERAEDRAYHRHVDDVVGAGDALAASVYAVVGPVNDQRTAWYIAAAALRISSQARHAVRAPLEEQIEDLTAALEERDRTIASLLDTIDRATAELMEATAGVRVGFDPGVTMPAVLVTAEMDAAGRWVVIDEMPLADVTPDRYAQASTEVDAHIARERLRLAESEVG